MKSINVIKEEIVNNQNVSTSTMLPSVAAEADDGMMNGTSSVMPEPPVLNGTHTDGLFTHVNPGALMRGSIVFGILCILVVLYIAFRTCRLRRNRKSARYNVLSTHDESAPLHSDDDEETVFDAAGSRR